ncbi:MAG: universal stress protein [Planctomycetota bacterium]
MSTTPSTPPRRIVAAVDLTAASHRVCHVAAEYARLLDAEIVLANVVHELASLLGVYTAYTVNELQESLEREGGEKLRSLAREHFDPAHVPHRVVLLVGTPWAELLDLTMQEDAVLLVMGTHSGSKPEHTFAGSCARRVVDNARCNVLLVPPE